jgi:hypothetical protein
MTKLTAIILGTWFISFLLILLYGLIKGGFRPSIKSGVAVAISFIAATMAVTIVSYLRSHLSAPSMFYFAPVIAGIAIEDIVVILFITRYSNSEPLDKLYSFKIGAGYTLLETLFQFSGIFYPIYVISSGEVVYITPGTQIEFYLALVIMLICVARLVGHYLLNIVLVTIWRNGSKAFVLLLILLHMTMDCVIMSVEGSQSKRLSISLLSMALVTVLLYFVLSRIAGLKAPKAQLATIKEYSNED